VQCIILAGGLGTRLGDRTADRPKAMIEIGGEPFIRHQLRLLFGAGVDDVVICIGYRGLLVEDEVARHSPVGMKVRCISDGQRLRGTAGAIRRAVEHGLTDEQFMVQYGDSSLSLDLDAVWRTFDVDHFDALMTVSRSDALDECDAGVGDGRVVVYRKDADRLNHPCMNHVDYGIGIFGADTLLDLVPPGVPYDLADLYETIAVHGRLQAFEVDQRLVRSMTSTVSRVTTSWDD
jgi:NDP-sugar pyrophosphorylase family protein